MSSPEISELLDHSTLSRHVTSPGERDRLYVRAQAGEVTRVFRGCYVETAFWLELAADTRHRALAHLATVRFGDQLVFSHLTAAALWRLPVLGTWPTRVHVEGHPGCDMRRSAAIARHAYGCDPASTTIDGLNVTSLAVTVASVAAAGTFAAGVVVADAALRRATHPLPGLPACHITADGLRAAASAIALHHGGARALAVADFADAAADRPGESISRCSIRAARLQAPQLQRELYGASGARYVVDFFWPELRLIGEFDGMVKYTDPKYLRGRTSEQAFADEKFREDDLRATGCGFSRWGWAVALSPARLATQLRQAGVR